MSSNQVDKGAVVLYMCRQLVDILQIMDGYTLRSLCMGHHVCVFVRVCACVRVRVCAFACVCNSGGIH